MSAQLGSTFFTTMNDKKLNESDVLGLAAALSVLDGVYSSPIGLAESPPGARGEKASGLQAGSQPESDWSPSDSSNFPPPPSFSREAEREIDVGLAVHAAYLFMNALESLAATMNWEDARYAEQAYCEFRERYGVAIAAANDPSCSPGVFDELAAIRGQVKFHELAFQDRLIRLECSRRASRPL